MKAPTFLSDPNVPLVGDSSTIINLIATGCAATILRAVPNPVVVVDVISSELDTGRRRGRPHADQLQKLVASGHIKIVALDDAGWLYFETLVIGPAKETLDDGEAATIAYAAEYGAIAIIDERKGTRLGAAHFPKLQIVSTVDVLLHPQIRQMLGDVALADAVFKALRDARMAVSPHNLEEVVHLIGSDRAAACLSLPKRVRSSTAQ